MIAPLNEYEVELVTDPEILLIKNKIIQKVQQFLGDMSDTYKVIAAKENCLSVINSPNAKISKGENYKGLPYVILDYPRQFRKHEVLAIRTFFWWGNFFSITLQLSGKYQQRYATIIETAIQQNVFEEWYISSSLHQWQHHFDSDNYTAISVQDDYKINARPFIKIAKKIPLSKWDEADLFLKENFSLLIKLINC